MHMHPAALPVDLIDLALAVLLLPLPELLGAAIAQLPRGLRDESKAMAI